jgi:hypothetical protein
MTGVALKNVWRSADAVVERDVLAYLRCQELLPEAADAALRLKELCIVAYDGPLVVGAITATLRRVEFLRARIALLRVSVGSGYRGAQLALNMLGEAQRVLDRWSVEHPEEKLMGVGTVSETKDIGSKLHEAVHQPFGLTLVSYTERGSQFRVAWFRHATIG